MFEVEAAVTGFRHRGPHYWVLGLEAPAIAAAARAGHFVNLGLGAGPLLRRPFSIYTADGGVVEVIFKPLGEGTDLLAGLREGDLVSVLGPLGRPFEFDSTWGTVSLLSGGLGVAPMALAARDAAAAGLGVTWVHGARTAAELWDEWWGDLAIFATDDGSRGFRGTVVAAAREAGAILACGPNPMLAAVAERWPEAQVAVETYMGCGTGVCLGCAVPGVDGQFTRACREGPVYRAGGVDWAALPGHLHYAAAR